MVFLIFLMTLANTNDDVVYEYAEGVAISIRESKPLLVCVGDVRAVRGTGCVLAESAELFDDKTPRYVLSHPAGERSHWVKDYASKPTPEMIARDLADFRRRSP